MPHRLRKTFGDIWPQWLLPSVVILKTLKTDWDNEKHYKREKERERKLELQREIDTYQEIKAFQGSLYPRFFGEVEVNGISDTVCIPGIPGIPGILISDIGGKTLCDVDTKELSAKRLRQLVKPPIRELVAIGKELTDLKLDNFHLIKGPSNRLVKLVKFLLMKGHSDRVMAFDFGDVDDRRSDDVDAICKELVDEVVQRYKRTSESKKALLAQGMKVVV